MLFVGKVEAVELVHLSWFSLKMASIVQGTRHRFAHPIMLNSPQGAAWGINQLSTKLITQEGFEALKKELDYLWREKRPDVTQKVTWAASLGDRSENADYQYNKKLLREIDRRVRYLRKRLEDMKVVSYSPEQEGRVFFGAWVDIENEEGETKHLRIVGYDEIYGQKDYISIDSPMARALLKKEVGDEALVQTPGGKMCWWINQIEYVK
jgi:transcription elongation factor GreB